MKLPEDHFITLENPEYNPIVETLAAEAFGPGRFTRTAFRLREGIAHEASLSFVCWIEKTIIASVRLTKIWVGLDEALLLGPLVVSPEYKALGYGGSLMRKAVSAAKNEGHRAIILVGDLPYYQKFGFEQVPAGQISLPGPVDPARLLICRLNMANDELLSGAAKPYAGKLLA